MFKYKILLIGIELFKWFYEIFIIFINYYELVN